MTQQQIEKKARECRLKKRLYEDKYPHAIIRIEQMYVEGYNASSLDSKNQIDKLTECLRELVSAEWMVTHDWGGDRDTLLDNARTLLATFTDKKLEDEKEK